MVTAVTTRSKPSVARELMKERVARDMNLMDLIRLGRHLDEVKETKSDEGAAIVEGKVSEVLAVEKFKGKREQKVSDSSQERESGYGRKARFDEERSERCGNCLSYHSKGDCSAKGRECHKCRGIGHYARACRNPRKDPRDGGRREQQGSRDHAYRWRNDDRTRFDHARKCKKRSSSREPGKKKFEEGK